MVYGLGTAARQAIADVLRGQMGQAVLPEVGDRLDVGGVLFAYSDARSAMTAHELSLPPEFVQQQHGWGAAAGILKKQTDPAGIDAGHERAPTGRYSRRR
jgi:hypothetical protein